MLAFVHRACQIENCLVSDAVLSFRVRCLRFIPHASAGKVSGEQLERRVSGFRRIPDTANIPALLDGHVTFDVESLDWLI